MHGVAFLQDMALVMLVAGIVTIIFHRFRQPVVLGYILAGLIIGPHTPPANLIQDKHTIDVLAELGMIMLMFGLGLHFSLKDLAKVGGTAFVAASLEILTLTAVGFGIGQAFSWSKLDSLFLGAILAISSTTIIIKALQELGLTKEKFATVIFGILIVEDILAIAMLALLSGIATTGQVEFADVIDTLGRLSIFLAVTLVVGLLTVPRLLRYIDRFKSSEMLLVSTLGICFGCSLLAAKMGYSVALGAFIGGAIVAEAREHAKIELLVQPVRDMFSAIFFVTIGMMIEPALLIDYAFPIFVITLAVVLGKITTCSIGAFVTGHSPRMSLRVGMGVAQIGEFSFIIASLGLSLGVISKFLYPIAVTVSAITTLLTPYLIKNSDKVATLLSRKAPAGALSFVRSYYKSFAVRGNAVRDPGSLALRRMLRNWGIQSGLNILLVTGVFIAAPFVARKLEDWKINLPEWVGGVRGLVWFAATAIALPLLVVTMQKLRAGSMLLAEIWTARSGGVNTSPAAQAAVSHTLFVVGAVLVALWINLISITVIPPLPVAIASVSLLLLIVTLRWRSFARIYGRAQSAIGETLADTTLSPIYASEQQRPMPPALAEAQIEDVIISDTSPARGLLIRELELRSRSGASAVAIERGNATIINPGPDEEILIGDRILLLGNSEQIASGKLLLQ